MVSWKVVLAVIIVAALAIAIGMWFGYRYVAEQDDISPDGQREPSNTTDSLFVLAPVHAAVSQGQCLLFKFISFWKGKSKL